MGGVMGKEKRQSPSTLLWFIRHKSYVPISEIRRRFVIDSDEGTFIEADNDRRVYVGLPPGTAQSLEKLWKQGKIGLEYSTEFDARVLIGVYPMHPAREESNGHGHHHVTAPYNGHSNGTVRYTSPPAEVPAEDSEISASGKGSL
jgi:hypothetical protein